MAALLFRAVYLSVVLVISLCPLASCQDVDASFKDWFIQNGGHIKGIDIEYFNNMGRGFIATEDILTEQEIIRIPNKLIFSLSNLKTLTSDPVLAEIMGLFAPDNAITAWLLLEKMRNDTSFFKPYIDVLPSYIPSLIHFSNKDIAELQNPKLEAEARDMQMQTMNDYDEFVGNAQSFWPVPLVNSASTFDAYKWAVTVINSRGLRFHGIVHLSPVADLFNYAPHADTRKASSGEFFTNHHKLAADGSIVILADRNVQKGLQAFEDYGDNNDDLYLKYHGFVASNNPFTCVTLDTSEVTVIKSQPHSELIKLLGFKAPPSQCVESNAQIGSNLKIFLLIIAATEDEVKACLDKIPDPKEAWTSMRSCPIGAAVQFLDPLRGSDSTESVLGERGLSLLRKVISTTVSKTSPTSIAHDKGLLQYYHNKLDACKSTPGEVKCALNEKMYIHRSLALSYRLHKKDLWLIISRIYNIKTAIDTLESLDLSRLIPEQIDMDESTSAAAIDIDSADSEDEDTLLGRQLGLFNDWFNANSPQPNKLAAALIPPFRVGTLAVEEVREGETYLGVPSAVIMDSETALKSSSVGPLMTTLMQKFKGHRDDFHELCFFLVYETFVLKETSFYWPYLSLLPTWKQMDGVPLTWTKQQIQRRLGNTSMGKAAFKYQGQVAQKYSSLAKNDAIMSYFPPGIFTLQTYRWATVILDSRSIWWAGSRHLVPMLDFINCKENEAKPDLLHSTVMDEKGAHAVTKGGGLFPAGTQVFENYGQPNHIYFMYHGFTLDNNTHDCVNIEFTMSKLEAQRHASSKVKGVMELSMRLGIPSQSKPMEMTACMKWPVPDEVWLYLALKMGTYEQQQSQRTLGTMSRNAAVELSVILQQQLLTYSAPDRTEHATSSRLLESEEQLLLYVQNHLQEALLTLEEVGVIDEDEDDEDDEL
jgi:hypothetical protein